MSNFLRHESCPDCGSSDALAVYQDGHKFCFACHKYTKADGSEGEADTVAKVTGLLPYDYRDLNLRSLTEATCRKFTYGVSSFKGQMCHVANYWAPDGSKIIAQKIRLPNKDFLVLGDSKAISGLLFGQQLWRDGGKQIVIAEGEIDALSVAQVEDCKWPVVSIPQGAQAAAKAIRANLEWLEKFEQVVLMFDMDDPGQKAAQECAEILSPGKARIAHLGLKDANELLKANRARELIEAKWNAKPFRPDGIVAGTDLWKRIQQKQATDSITYPWGGLQKILLGCRTREIVTFTAGTGQGKSSIIREMAYHFAMKEKETVGCIFLEESVERAALGVMGLHLNKPIRIDRSTVSDEDLLKSYQETIGNGRFVFYDHWGSTDPDNLLNKVRYMIRGCGCKTIILDHISIVVSGMEGDDERKQLDVLMTKLRTLVEETECRLILVTHLKRPEGRGHEEGAATSLSQLRGSAAIGQLSDIVIGLERNQQDEENKNVSTLRILKNRWTGETGVGCYLKYDPATGRLSESDPYFSNATATGTGSGTSENPDF